MELLVAPIDFEFTQVIATLDLVQVMLADCVILYFGFNHIDLWGLILSAGHKIFEGGYDGGNKDGLLRFTGMELLREQLGGWTLHHKTSTHTMALVRILYWLLLRGRKDDWV